MLRSRNFSMWCWQQVLNDVSSNTQVRVACACADPADNASNSAMPNTLAHANNYN